MGHWIMIAVFFCFVFYSDTFYFFNKWDIQACAGGLIAGDMCPSQRGWARGRGWGAAQGARGSDPVSLARTGCHVHDNC